MKTLFVQAPFPQFYDLLRHVGEKHAHDIGGLVYHTADAALLGEARFVSVPIILGGDWFPYEGAGTRYFEGMMNDVWRWNMIQSSKSRTINGVGVIEKPVDGFYITEEIDISSLVHVGLRQRVEWFLLDMLRFYYQLDPAAPVLWSPFASTKSLNTLHIAAFKTLLVNVFAWLKLNDGIAPLLQIHFQDGVGAKAHTILGAAQWGTGIQKSIQSSSDLNTVSFYMNIEMFQVDGNGVHSHASLGSIAEREYYYQGIGLEAGACWEARYWRPYVGYLNNHVEGP